MTEAPVAAADLPAQPALDRFDAKKIYDGDILFHGRDFQVIDAVEGISDEGIKATLKGTLDAGGQSEPWKTDPAAMDGGLQLALLWSQKVLGGASLPMAVGSLNSYASAPKKGQLQATLSGQKTSRDRAVSNIVFTDEDGAVVAELRGVETILRPN